MAVESPIGAWDRCPSSLVLSGTAQVIREEFARQKQEIMVEVIREEFAIQRQEITVMLSRELDGFTASITDSIREELSRFFKTFQANVDIIDVNHTNNNHQFTSVAIMDDPTSSQNWRSSTCERFQANGNPSASCITLVDTQIARPKGATRKTNWDDTKICSSRERPSILQKFIDAKDFFRDDDEVIFDDRKIGNYNHIQKCLHSQICEYGIALLILVNAVMFGWQADHAIAYPDEDPPRIFRLAEWCFTGAFTIELSLRVLGYGCSFFAYSNPDVNWNLLDLILVVFAYTEALLRQFNVPNLSSARLVRLLRLLRIVRMLRLLRVLKDMRVMVLSILGSLKPLFWALMLLGLIIYTFAILLQQLVQHEMTDLKHVRHFTSFMRLMYALFMCISGGLNWIDVVDPIQHISPIIAPLFVLYVGFTVFCVLNIVTGFFVEQAHRMSQEDEENMLLNEIETRRKWMDDVAAVFRQADKEGAGELTFQDFALSLSDLRVSTALKACGIDLNKTSLSHIWELLDFDRSGKIGILEFTEGLKQIHGDAKGIDMARIKHELRKVHHKLNMIIQKEEEFEKLRKQDRIKISCSSRKASAGSHKASAEPAQIRRDARSNSTLNMTPISPVGTTASDSGSPDISGLQLPRSDSIPAVMAQSLLRPLPTAPVPTPMGRAAKDRRNGVYLGLVAESSPEWQMSNL